MRIQLWSYNHDPEPTGIGIVSTVWARGLRDRGHQVEVVAESRPYTDKWRNAPGRSRTRAGHEPRLREDRAEDRLHAMARFVRR